MQTEFPDTSVQLVVGCADAANGKVGVLIELARHARHPIWVVNDSDIKVNPDYLAEVVAPLADSQIGVVTCPYRALAHNVPAAWESIGIATDFIPSALVAQLVGVREFGFGSTLAFRAADLERVGGFKALADYLADDYQLAKRITSLGKRALLSTYVVETSLGDSTWPGIWRHQLRWARTIRLSKGRGHAGLPITHAGVWILIAIACGAWLPAAILIGTRMLSALITGWFVLRSQTSAAFFWLAPAWDFTRSPSGLRPTPEEKSVGAIANLPSTRKAASYGNLALAHVSLIAAHHLQMGLPGFLQSGPIDRE